MPSNLLPARRPHIAARWSGPRNSAHPPAGVPVQRSFVHRGVLRSGMRYRRYLKVSLANNASLVKVMVRLLTPLWTAKADMVGGGSAGRQGGRRKGNMCMSHANIADRAVGHGWLGSRAPRVRLSWKSVAVWKLRSGWRLVALALQTQAQWLEVLGRAGSSSAGGSPQQPHGRAHLTTMKYDSAGCTSTVSWNWLPLGQELSSLLQAGCRQTAART